MPSADFGRIDLGDVTPHNIKLLRNKNYLLSTSTQGPKMFYVLVSLKNLIHLPNKILNVYIYLKELKIKMSYLKKTNLFLFFLQSNGINLNL